MLGVFVDREAGARRRQLEQHAARLAKVDAQEVLPIDDLRRPSSDLHEVFAPVRVLVVAIAPGNVMHRPRARQPGGRGRLAIGVAGSPPASFHDVLASPGPLEAHRGGQQVVLMVDVDAVHVDAVETQQRMFSGNVSGIGTQRLVVGLDDPELQLEALRVAEPQRPFVGARLELNAFAREPLGPEGQRRRRRHPPAQPVDHPRAGTARRRIRELEERQDRTRCSALVPVVEVVDVRRIEIDRLLDQPQPEHARVEVDISGSVRRDAGDVVDAIKLHVAVLLGRVLAQAAH